MDISERVDYFLELMSCSQNIGYWCFDMDRHLLRSTSPYQDEKTFVRLVFGDDATFAKVKALGEAIRTPVISYNDIDLCSAFVFEYSDAALCRMHILGPLYQSDITVDSIEKELDRHYMSSRFRRRAIHIFNEIFYEFFIIQIGIPHNTRLHVDTQILKRPADGVVRVRLVVHATVAVFGKQFVVFLYRIKIVVVD